MTSNNVVDEAARQRAAQALERLRKSAKRPPSTWSHFLWLKWDACRRLVSSAICRLIISLLWRLTFGRFLYVKRVNAVVSAEAAAMQSVRRHTSIPVPRPWCTFRWGGDAFLVMQKVSGAPLYASLWDTFTEEEKYKVVEQLRGFVQQIRAIPPRPGAVIGPVLDGAQSSDHRLCGVPHGPYLNEDQMNHQLRMGLPLHRFPSMVIESHSRQHPLVFTHGDIAMRNMMLEGRRVVVLIDWEGAGWYPAHWEYCKAHYGSFLDGDDWRSRIREFIPPYEFENEADYELRKWQGFEPDLPPMKLDAPCSPDDKVEVYFRNDPTRCSIEDGPLFSLVW